MSTDVSARPVPPPLRVGHVPGVMPDKWFRRWRERFPGRPLEAWTLVEPEAGLGGSSGTGPLDRGEVDVALLRVSGDVATLRVSHHAVVLHEEQPGVAGGKDHALAVVAEADVAELADETVIAVPGPLAADVAEALDLVAAGVGVVFLPRPLLRHHSRGDVVHRPLTGVPATEIAVVWRRDDAREAEIQDLVGILRGCTAGTSRGGGGESAESPSAGGSARRRKPGRKAGDSPVSRSRKRGRMGRKGR